MGWGGGELSDISSKQAFSHAINERLSITFNVIRYKWPPSSTSCIIGLSADSGAHFSSANAYSFLAIKLKVVGIIYLNKKIRQEW